MSICKDLGQLTSWIGSYILKKKLKIYRGEFRGIQPIPYVKSVSQITIYVKITTIRKVEAMIAWTFEILFTTKSSFTVMSCTIKLGTNRKCLLGELPLYLTPQIRGLNSTEIWRISLQNKRIGLLLYLIRVLNWTLVFYAEQQLLAYF